MDGSSLGRVLEPHVVAEFKIRVVAFGLTAIVHGAIIAAIFLTIMPSARKPGGSTGDLIVLQVYDVAAEPRSDLPEFTPSPGRDALPFRPAKTDAIPASPMRRASATAASTAILSPGAGAAEIGPALAPAASAAADSRYRTQLRDHILRFLDYPAAANGALGLVRLQLALDRDGSVLDAWVVQSSGNTILDAAALASLRRAEPLPRIPDRLPQTLEVSMPIDFAKVAASESPSSGGGRGSLSAVD